MKEIRGARLTRRQSQNIVDNVDWSEGESKRKNYDPFEFMQKQAEERGREKEGIFYFERKEKNFRQPRADFFCCWLRLKGRRRQPLRISLILIKSYCNTSPTRSALEMPYEIYTYANAHTNVLFKGANFPLLFLHGDCKTSFAENPANLLKFREKRQERGSSFFDLACALHSQQITSVKSQSEN